MHERSYGRRLGLLVIPVALLGTLGCNGLTNQLQGTQHLSLPSITPGTMASGYTQTTFQDSIDSSKVIHILAVSISSSTNEFSWLASIDGAAPTGQLLVSRSPMDDTASPVDLNIVDTGDVRPYFVDDHTVRLDWTAQMAPTLSQSYPDGVTVTIAYTLEVD